MEKKNKTDKEFTPRELEIRTLSAIEKAVEVIGFMYMIYGDLEWGALHEITLPPAPDGKPSHWSSEFRTLIFFIYTLSYNVPHDLFARYASFEGAEKQIIWARKVASMYIPGPAFALMSGYRLAYGFDDVKMGRRVVFNAK